MTQDFVQKERKPLGDLAAFSSGKMVVTLKILKLVCTVEWCIKNGKESLESQ